MAIIEAYPSKKLFISILTQDVSAKACILDLIDNSVDSYIRTEIADRRKIIVDVTEDLFRIHDTCGGINKNMLEKDVFRFGAINLQGNKPTLGMYGIGLKRSIFKIGNNITLITDDGTSKSEMQLDVEEWEAKKEWDIEYKSSDSELKSNECGYTLIEIKDIYPDIAKTFTNVTILSYITSIIEKTYCWIMGEGKIDIIFNKNKLVPEMLFVPTDSEYEPAVYMEKYGVVNIKIVCYVDPNKGKLSDASNKVGWNIFCNTRLILANDTSPITGWIGGRDESNLPKYHEIYNEFRGIVFLQSKNPFSLPLNTSKSSLNIEHPIYHYVLNKMIVTARPVINYLSKKYIDEKKREDEILNELENNELLTEQINGSISAMTLSSIKTFKAPDRQVVSDVTNIQYSKPNKIVNTVKKHLKVRSNKEVGIKTFEYYVEMEELDD